MIQWVLRGCKNSMPDLLRSELYNDSTFYPMFIRDLKNCTKTAFIESPFITSNRVASLLPIFEKMRSRGIEITVNTRHPAEHDAPYDSQAWDAVSRMQDIGVQILFTGGHHRKIAILDQAILWEGSLNILSQHQSCEIMRRSASQELVTQMLQFIKLEKFMR